MHNDIVENVRDFEKEMDNANNDIGGALGDMSGALITANGHMGDLKNTAVEFYEYLNNNSGVLQKAQADMAEYSKAISDMRVTMDAEVKRANARAEAAQAASGNINFADENANRELDQSDVGTGYIVFKSSP